MLRIVYGLKLDCEVTLWTRRIGWRDTTNNGGSELAAKLQRSNHQVCPGHDDIICICWRGDIFLADTGTAPVLM